MDKDPATETRTGVSKVKLAIGAASLFLFIVGVKRSFRMDDSPQEERLSDGGEERRKPEGARA